MDDAVGFFMQEGYTESLRISEYSLYAVEAAGKSLAAIRLY
jgi:hypothetical protein